MVTEDLHVCHSDPLHALGPCPVLPTDPISESPGPGLTAELGLGGCDRGNLGRSGSESHSCPIVQRRFSSKQLLFRRGGQAPHGFVCP